MEKGTIWNPWVAILITRDRVHEKYSLQDCMKKV
jgi:hypothetical protein